MSDLLKGMLAVVLFEFLVVGDSLMAQNRPTKNIVLVHEAFADGSSCSKTLYAQRG